MGLLIAGSILGALLVILALVAFYFSAQYRVASKLVKYLAGENAKLEQELRKTVSTLQEAITPINVKMSDEQALKMAHMINYAIEQLRKAETVGMN